MDLRKEYEKETGKPTQVMNAMIGKPQYYGEYVEWLEKNFQKLINGVNEIKQEFNL